MNQKFDASKPQEQSLERSVAMMSTSFYNIANAMKEMSASLMEIVSVQHELLEIAKEKQNGNNKE